jgi:aminoglycoside phosphotransferase (APT) family kinase protein
VRTLAKLHRVNPASLGLSTFGKPTGFYDRQIATFRTISESQGRVEDVETRKSVGAIPKMDEILDFFSDHRTQPLDRGTIIHGDYKIDNLVYHETEPRVIGILEYVSPFQQTAFNPFRRLLLTAAKAGRCPQ